jgi:hypothetical protein
MKSYIEEMEDITIKDIRSCIVSDSGVCELKVFVVDSTSNNPYLETYTEDLSVILDYVWAKVEKLQKSLDELEGG